MAIRYDPRLYTAGTAVFNPEPITRASEYVSRVAQAKNAALDQYYQKRGDSINAAGMRNQDLGDFQEKLTNLKDYYLVNKDKLRKGDVLAQSNYEKLFRDAQGIVARSKNKTEIGDKLFEVQKMQRDEGGAPTQELMDAIKINDLPVSHKDSRDIDPNYFMGEPKPFDLGKHLKTYEDIPRTMGMPVVGATDPKTGKRLITETEVFDDNAKNTIALRAGSAYQNDRSFQREVNRATADPAAKKQLEDVYQSQFGEAPKESHDYATAYILSQKQLTKTTPKLDDDKEWAAANREKERIARDQRTFNRQVALQAIKAKDSNEGIMLRNKLKVADKKEQDSIVDITYEDIKADAIKNGKWHHILPGGKQSGEYYMTKIPNSVRAEFGKKDETTGKLQYPDEVAFNDDHTVDVLFFKPDQVGNKKAIDNTRTHKITENEFKATIGKKLFGVKGASGATYFGDDNTDDDEDGGEEGVVVPARGNPVKKQLEKPKIKIPGF